MLTLHVFLESADFRTAIQKMTMIMGKTSGKAYPDCYTASQVRQPHTGAAERTTMSVPDITSMLPGGMTMKCAACVRNILTEEHTDIKFTHRTATPQIVVKANN